jgi:hypothetical protein
VIVAMLLLAWGPPMKSETPFNYMLDADVCLAPEEGLFEPVAFLPYRTLVRELLLSDTGNQTALHVLVQPSFQLPYSLRIEQPAPSGDKRDETRPNHLRLVRAKKHPWVQMMEKMQGQQGNVIHLGDAEQKRALAAISTPTETKTLPVPATLAGRLGGVWAGVLARTQYPNEIKKAPDGCHLEVVKMDGTSYHFWQDRRSGTTHSPKKGTLLGDLVAAVETLTRFADAPPAKQPALLRQLDADLARLQQRIQRNEPCLRPRPYDGCDD